ncbi:hypothetical protein FRX31_025596 [Thalictrum thalictroides]|uniref:25S rRNA (uridine-N(3))-methyltransferase BMT5-like domain-containing protein n=1 Tax=Thalictrum thalictroides TaxID=46969 RepID=A0A7J6VJ78_THATH|nr:hypothetical protein FRX31_025596 [Thalictrum thalictroides]
MGWEKMGQILAKISEFITNITCRFSSRGSYQNIYTQEVEDERERLITIQDTHIAIPREDEVHDQLSRLISTNEIVDGQGLVIEIPDAYHTVSTYYPRENDNGSRGSLEQNSQSSLVSTDDPPLKLVDNVAVQKEDVGGQPKRKNKRGSRKKKDKWIKHYCSSHDILLVGEGDFSFSVCLSKAFGSATASKMIATSLDSEGNVSFPHQFLFILSYVSYYLVNE